MSKDGPVVGMAVADLHLWHQAPGCRAEKDWIDLQAKYLGQLAKRWGEYGEPPLLIPGDLFERWNPHPAVITMALDCLPTPCYAVPGNHDLPHHNLEQMDRSAFWTLVRAGAVTLLHHSRPRPAGELVLWGYPFGQPVRPRPHYDGGSMSLHVAVVHDYIWRKGCGYPGAPEEKQVGRRRTDLEGYDVAVFGDNHVPFDHLAGDCEVSNCGTFIRRKRDEVRVEPSVVLIYQNGTTGRSYLDITGDLFHELPTQSEINPAGTRAGVDQFLTDLETLSGAAIDFGEALKRTCEDRGVNEQVRRIIFKALDEELR